jgi:hypothetical protein
MIARLISKELLGELLKGFCGIAKKWRTSCRHCSAAKPSRGNRGRWELISASCDAISPTPLRPFRPVPSRS